MNNTFNINRFGLLLKRQWLDFGKVYLGTLVVLTGILILAYWVFIPSTDKIVYGYDGRLDLRFRYLLYIFLGFFFTSLIASNYFNNLGQKANSIVELMTPASVLEKFLTSFFYSSIVSIISFTLVFYLVDLCFVSLLNSQLSLFKVSAEYKTQYKPGELLPTQSIIAEIFEKKANMQYLKSFFIFPFTIASIFLLGSIYFNRFHYIKTAIALTLFCILWWGSTLYFLNLITKDTVWIGNQYWVSEENVMNVFGLVGLAITACFWITTYIRLKEKEV